MAGSVGRPEALAPTHPAGDRRGPDADPALWRVLSEQQEIADRLVGLEPIPLEALTGEIERLATCLLIEHPQKVRPFLRGGSERATSPGLARMLEREHRWFGESIGGLRELARILSVDDHGGHRQALGQYWRLVVESARRHLNDEVATSDAGPTGSPAGGSAHRRERSRPAGRGAGSARARSPSRSGSVADGSASGPPAPSAPPTAPGSVG